MKYLDLIGLGEVWANIKSYISSKIPTKTSQLQNDSNYVTTSQLPSKTSQLTNDSGFTTIADTVLKTNTDYTFRNYALNSLNFDEKYNENYVVGISEDGYGTRPIGGWTNIINFCTYHFMTQLCIPIHPNKDTDCMYIRTRWANDTTWGEWRKSANDNDVVHKSGNEIISGIKNFNDVVLGEQSGVIRIGNNGEGALFCNLYYDGGIYNNIKLFYPKTDNEYYLGTPSNKWKDIYATTFSCLAPIDKATTNTSWSIYRPFRVVDKDNSIELGYVEYGYKSDLAFTRLSSYHNNGGWGDLTIHTNGISYFNNCRELWLINKNLGSYNTAPSNEIDTQIWFTDKNANKYATLQTLYFNNGIRHFALTHKSLRTNTWTGLNMITSPTDDIIVSQPKFRSQDSLSVFDGTNLHNFVDINKGWIEMSNPGYSYIDFKHEGSQDYLARLALSPDNTLFLETKNGAPIMANGKSIVRSVNGVNADNNGNVSIQGFSNGVGEIIQGYYVPNGIVQKSGSVYFGTLARPEPGATLSDFRDINITITDEFHPEAGKIYDYSQIFSTLYLHSYDSEYAVGANFDCYSSPKLDKWFGGWIKVAGSNLVRNSGKYLCTSVSPYGYAVTLRYNLTMSCEMVSNRPGGSSPNYSCKIVSKTVPQNQMTVTSKATFMRVG